MKINAICMVKNEVDIIEETLLNAMKFCHKIYIFDNWSTDGTWEIVESMAKRFKEIEIAAHSEEVFKNQLRNRVYNQFHRLYTKEDWWYILDADEMLVESPKPMLEKAAKKGKNVMRSWFAQFYFTEKDLDVFANEDKTKPVSHRRKFYRVNWREVRFFKNDPDISWPETITGRVPPHCNKMYRDSPICRHYAERDPEQIAARNSIRINNPYSFFHVRSKKANHSWIRNSKDYFYYCNDGKFHFPITDKIKYYLKEVKHWFYWRWQNVCDLPGKVLAISKKRASA